MFDRFRIMLLKRLDNTTKKLASLDAPCPTPEYENLITQGNALVQADKYAEAERCFRSALLIRQNDTAALVNLGFVLKQQKRLEEARVYLKRALLQSEHAPSSFETHYLFGVVAEEQGNLDEATASFKKSHELKPDFELACRDLCRVLFQTGNLTAAQAVLDQGLALNPEFADFHFYQGNLHIENSQPERAIQSYAKAIASGANYADIHAAMGNVQYSLGNKDAAIESFKNAHRFDLAAGAEALYQSGYFHLRNGQPANAFANFEMAIALHPDFLKAHSILLFTLSFSPRHSQTYQEFAQRYAVMLREKAQFVARPLKQAYQRGNRPLRIGFVSGDLKAHPVGSFLEGILGEIDPQRVYLIAYSNTSNEDQISTRLRALFAEWHDIKGLDDDAAAQLIRDHSVDILVDLAGHTGENRLPVFTRQPAPVQVTWLGYFASTGLSEMDFILADAVSVPAHQGEFFSEKIWYLPETRLCMTPPITSHAIEVSALPAQANGYVTFGSFQSRSKINQKVLQVWSQVLAAVPTSRLRLQLSLMDNPARREELLQKLEQAGIDRERVSLSGDVHWEEYLRSYKHVDMLLDTFPYPGGTTTAEALWMGVPTITLMGNTMLSRQGASMLRCVGLDDWIADSEDAYLAKAVRFAGDVPALARMRAELRDQAIQSPLFDTRRFAENLQDSFESMFQNSE